MEDELKLTFWFGSDIPTRSTDLEISIDKVEFEHDMLLVLACAYVAMSYASNYVSVIPEISDYFAYRFPEHADMFGDDGLRLYDCSVPRLRSFDEMLMPLLGKAGEDGKKQFIAKIGQYNLEHFSIWK